AVALAASVVYALIAFDVPTSNSLRVLHVSTGYNPVRRYPRRRIKPFLFHKWTGYTALAVAALHPSIILLSSTAQFRLFDLLVPIWSPTQPFENTLGAVALYLVAFAVATSYFRYVIGFHRWKQFHYVTYAAAG